MLKLLDVNISGQRVLIREDLNVPIYAGHITSDARIVASLPTIRHCLEHHARVLIMSHLGRPEEGKFDEQYSLAPLQNVLSEIVKSNCAFNY